MLPGALTFVSVFRNKWKLRISRQVLFFALLFRVFRRVPRPLKSTAISVSVFSIPSREGSAQAAAQQGVCNAIQLLTSISLQIFRLC